MALHLAPARPRRMKARRLGRAGARTVKIASVKVYVVDIDGRRPVLVQTLTDEGLSGVGDAAIAYGVGAFAAAAMIEELSERFLLGADPFRIEALWSEMYDHTFWAKGGGPIVFAGMSAIEQSLWDIKGKALGVPAYELLGGKVRDSIRVYANGWSFRCVTPDDFARAAERVVEDGYTALKFYPLASAELDAEGHIRHVSHRTIDPATEQRAVDRVAAVRRAVGPGIQLMLDMSGELTPDAIVRIGRAVAGPDILFFEEPVDPFDVPGLKQVADRVPLSIAVGERLYSRYGFRPVVELRAADVLQPDIGNTGGLMEAKKIAAMAEAWDMLVAPHNCSSPVGTAAALQLDACIPNFLIQEVYPYRAAQHFGIVDRAPELSIRGGAMPVPDRPGLGVDLVESRVRAFLWAECPRR
jgi:galactonate dehydratase